MPVEVVMPKLGLTMASGTIARWIKQPGEAVRAGEPLVEVATDKITYEVESPASGTVVRALGNDGDEFACGAVIGTIAVAGESDTAAPDARAETPSRSASRPIRRLPAAVPRASWKRRASRPPRTAFRRRSPRRSSTRRRRRTGRA